MLLRRCQRPWRFAVSVGRPLRLPCPAHTTEQDANLLPIIHVFVLADAASGTFSTKQIHLTHFLPSALRCPISLILHVQISVLSNESVDIHSLFRHLSIRSPSPPPRQRQTPAQLKGDPAERAITASSSSRTPTVLQHFRFTRFDRGGEPHSLASPLVAADPAFLLNETHPLPRVALTDNHDFE